MYKNRILFPGRDSLDQLCRIFSLTGTPASNQWEEGVALLNRLAPFSEWSEPQFPLYDTLKMKLQKWKYVHESARRDDFLPCFLTGLLTLDPSQRLTASQALQHGYFLFSEPESNTEKAATNTPCSMSLATAATSLKKIVTASPVPFGGCLSVEEKENHSIIMSTRIENPYVRNSREGSLSMHHL
jgi:serine/threonine protein kinase